jgi:cytidylate kinase
MGLIISVDGTGASGKSTFCKNLAQILDGTHINTGKFYRATTHLMQLRKAEYTDTIAAEKAADHIMKVWIDPTICLQITEDCNISARGVFNEEKLYSPEITMDTLKIINFPGVRSIINDATLKIVETVRNDPNARPLIVDGRGQFKAIKADYGFFITCDYWTKMIRKKLAGDPTPYQDLLENLRQRDLADGDRADKTNTCVLNSSSQTPEQMLKSALKYLHNEFDISTILTPP